MICSKCHKDKVRNVETAAIPDDMQRKFQCRDCQGNAWSPMQIHSTGNKYTAESQYQGGRVNP